MDKWSKKYNKWFRCEDKNQHQDNKNLYKFGKYWWNYKKDIMIHEDIVDDYIENINKLKKKAKKDAFCIKNDIQIKN